MILDNLSPFLDGACFVIFAQAIALMFALDSFKFFGKEVAFRKVGFIPLNIAYLVFYSALAISNLAGLFGWF